MVSTHAVARIRCPLEGPQHTLGGIDQKFENAPLHSAHLRQISLDAWKLSLRYTLSQTGSGGDGTLAAAENLVNGTVGERDHEQVAVRPSLDVRADIVGPTA
jgi:hypothetical protein